MRGVTKHDCIRQSEITLILNDKDQVIGVEVYFEEPRDLIDFRLEDVFVARRIARPQPVIPPPPPPSPEHPTPRSVANPSVRQQKAGTQASKPCGGCGK